MVKVSRADPFDVWGWPPNILLKGLSPKQTETLRRYVSSVTEKSYRIAYDNGLIEGLTKISLVASMEMKKQRDRMRTK